MAKRRADKEINHDNWDNEDDEEAEDPGKFKQADTDELKRRVIKVGRRSVSNSPAAPSPFATFGFGSAAPKPAAPPSMLPNGSAEAKEAPSLSNPKFLGKLKSLNECLVRWLQKHLDSNPYRDFTPVFRDYERHLKEIRSEASSPASLSTSSSLSSSTASGVSTGGITFNFNTGSQASKVDLPGGSTISTSKSISGFPNVGTPAASKPTFSFTLAATAPTATQENSEDPEDEKYVPPKNEFVAVEEKDALYSKRCKLFHKKGDGYVERGVGTLYVKPLNGRHQLLLRADTSLGNILLNILLAPSLPVSRLGKNNVALVCVPNPPMDPNDTSPAPTTLLLRVRTADDADELRDTLNRYKGQS
uniref:Putative nuclear pore complex component n=1 Tax=Ixodes ricinus TaxID=34613 RepID=A0A131XVG7_IXORI